MRNLYVMTAGYAINSIATTMIMSAAPLIIQGMGVTDDMIPPLGVATFMYGAAFFNLLSAWTIKKLGRKKAYMLGELVGVIGAVAGIFGAYFGLLSLTFVAFAIPCNHHHHRRPTILRGVLRRTCTVREERPLRVYRVPTKRQKHIFQAPPTCR